MSHKPSPPRPPAKLAIVPAPAPMPDDGPLSERGASIADKADHVGGYPPVVMPQQRIEINYTAHSRTPLPLPPAVPVDLPESGPKSLRVRAGETAKHPAVVLLSALLSGGAGNAAWQSYTERPQPVDSSGAAACATVASALEKFSGEQRAWNEKTSGKVDFTIGVLNASGYRFTPAPDRDSTPPPKVEAKVLEPLGKKSSAAKQVQVTTPLPESPKQPDAVVLPAILSDAKPPKQPDAKPPKGEP